MKRIVAYNTFLLILSALLAGCAGHSASASPTATTPIQTIISMPAVTGPSQTPSLQPGQPAYTFGEDNDSTPQPQIPWEEPESVDYKGKYLDIALDKSPAKYPAMKMTKAVETTWGSVKIPGDWSIQDADAQYPQFVDAKNRVVGGIYQLKCYAWEPYYALKPEDDTLIAWEKPEGFPDGARAMALESDYSAASAEKMKTIVRTVCIFSDIMVDDDGYEYFVATCLSIDKAYIVNGKIDYVISNKAIDEIAGRCHAWRGRGISPQT